MLPSTTRGVGRFTYLECPSRSPVDWPSSESRRAGSGVSVLLTSDHCWTDAERAVSPIPGCRSLVHDGEDEDDELSPTENLVPLEEVMMHAHAFTPTIAKEEPTPDAELLGDMLQALRDEMKTIRDEVHEVLEENGRLQDEISQLRTSRRRKKKEREADRIRRECLQGLARLKEMAGQTNATGRRRAPTRRGGESHRAWMKKMMMMMMLSEMA